MKRRDFFKTAAAVSTAVAVPSSGRAFARTLEDRDSVEAPAPGRDELIFRLYSYNEVVAEEKRGTSVQQIGDAYHFGIGASEAFEFDKTVTITKVTVAPVAWPSVEADLKIDGSHTVLPGSTFTLMADATHGFLKLGG